MLNEMPSNECWSEVFGYLSIVCWVIVTMPQLYENYTRKNTDGVSIPFLLLWLIGDIFNVVGIVLQKLLTTMLLLAIYYLLSDFLLMFQVIYYRGSSTSVTKDTFIDEVDCESHSPHGSTSENTPLLRSTSNDSSSNTISSQHIKNMSENTIRFKRVFYVTSALYVLVVLGGSILYLFWPLAEHKARIEDLDVIAQLFGWSSAALYCCSRIPQIMMNFRNESVEGLSLTMFVLSVLGNLTYCVSIFFKSLDRTYLLINYPWLLGSGGTLFFDFTIFFQFYVYRRQSSSISK